MPDNANTAALRGGINPGETAMNKYEIIIRSCDRHWKFRPNDFEQVLNLVRHIIESGRTEQVEFFLKGKESTADKIIQAAEEDRDAYWEKKNQTHKQILIGTGVTSFVKKKVWVRR